MRTKPEWGTSVLSLVTLTGGLFMLSDPIHMYDEQRVRTIQRCLPPLETITAETGPLDVSYQAYAWTKLHGVDFTGEIEYDWKEVNDEDARIISGDHETMYDAHPLASLWAFHLHNEAGEWCVVQRIANLPLPASTVKLDDLGLDPSEEYAVFDFWNERYLGTARNTIELEPLKLGLCQVLAFRRVVDHPQFLATTRHVSMGVVSVGKQTWRGNTLTVHLRGLKGEEETYWFHAPDQWQLDRAKAVGAILRNGTVNDQVLPVSVRFKSPQSRISLSWRRT
jgi:hypothetical protein